MASKSVLLIVAAALSGCSYHRNVPVIDAGVAAVNVPVVSRADYVFDASAPDGLLPASEAARLDGWFRSLGLSYGDAVYVDGAYAEGARAQVAEVAGRYGLMVVPGAPVTAGAVAPGTVRIVVSRTVASVPNCPNWSRPSQPNYNNQIIPNFGCAVNGSLAAMVANPEDLIHGQAVVGGTDASTAVKPVTEYRTQEPTGKKGLADVNTKKGN